MKMKSLMWKPISIAQRPGTCWEKIDDTYEKLDLDSIEKYFGQKKRKKKKKGEKKKEEVKKIEKIELLDAGRNQNIMLILGKLRMANELICESLFSCDEKILNESTCTALKGALPEPEELKMLMRFIKDRPKDIPHLAKVETFFLAIIKVPGYAQRVNAFKFQHDSMKMIKELDSYLDAILRFYSKIL